MVALIIHKYKGHKIIYKDDFVALQGYVNESLKTYKYILKYDYEGNLLECIDNKYGLKFTGSQADNCKLNTRLILLNRNDSLRVYQGKYVFIRSNEIVQHIKTNITIYSYYDLELRKMNSFLKQVDLIKSLKITKGTFEYYLKNKQEYNKRYLFRKEIY